MTMDLSMEVGSETDAGITPVAPRAATGRFRTFRQFLENTSGNIAMTFGLAAIPLCVAAGCAVDLSQALIARQRLSHALDAAGLAVGRTVGLSEAQMQTLAQQFFDANYPADALGTPGPVALSLQDNRITLAAHASVNTAIMRLVGIDTIDVSTVSQITRENKGLELALVLDVTGSMGSGGKIEALKSSATELINILFGDSMFPDLLKIGIVPFATGVKLDPAVAVGNGWIDTNGTSSVAQLNFSGGRYAYWLYTNAGGLNNTPWTGCVEARPNRLDETDTVPTMANPDSRWVPMFQPDEPRIREPENDSWNPAGSNQTGLNSSFTNDYISMSANVTGGVNISLDRLTSTANHNMQTGDGPFRMTTTGSMPGGTNGTTDYWVIRLSNTQLRLATSRANALANTYVDLTSTGSGTLALVESWGDATTASQGTSLAHQTGRQRNWMKYVGRQYTGTNGPYTGCFPPVITDLTNDKALLLNRINALTTNGNTHIPLGLSWGWRLVSPGEPFTRGVAYDDDSFIKAIVLMTDGDNTMSSQNSTLNRTVYSPYGYGAQQRMGAGITTATNMKTEMDASLTRTCNNIKALQDQDGEDRVRIYTIAFTVTDPTTINLLRNCASKPEMFFNSGDSAALQTAFQTIATDLSNLRISQ